ncbi:LytR/AlgR family response regulator transcription factor [Pedobacter jamesrossensis]|uniref:LytR/AlgR family response regulator transcription factor n=1 Tax=Pedobacter jamesrossensis TaxID=1908238 RepID=A0ABV8NI99_9SPHI
MRCYIIDDERFSIENLESYIEKFSDLELVGFNTNPVIAIEEISTYKNLQLIFLDINMPELSGLDVADLISKDIGIIFITGYSEHAHNAFEKGAIDFLYKPISFVRFSKAVLKAQKYLSELQVLPIKEADWLFVDVVGEGKLIKIDISEIIYFEAQNMTLCIQTKNEKEYAFVRLKDAIESLPKEIFCQIHRSFVVNVNHIREIRGNQVTMSNNSIIPFGKLYKEKFLDNIRHKMFINYRR